MMHFIASLSMDDTDSRHRKHRRVLTCVPASCTCSAHTSAGGGGWHPGRCLVSTVQLPGGVPGVQPGICCINCLTKYVSEDVERPCLLAMYRNEYCAEPSTPVQPTDDLHEKAPVADYNLNSFVPPPPGPLTTDLVTLEPLVVRTRHHFPDKG